MRRRATCAPSTEVIDGADLFLGLSGPGRPDGRDGAADGGEPDHLRPRQPQPGDRPGRGARGRPGRDHRHRAVATIPNQVNNVLCFPFIFRGALDVGATEINDEMKIACIEGIAALARATSSAEAAAAYQGERLSFGRDYLIPKPFDPRLLAIVASAVAAGRDGDRRRHCARSPTSRPTRRTLNQSVFRSAFIMRRVFEVAHSAGRRIVFAEGEDERVLHAAFAMIEERVGQADPDRPPRRHRGALRARARSP